MSNLEQIHARALQLSRSGDDYSRAKAKGIATEAEALLKAQRDAEYQAELSSWLGMADWGKKPA